MGKSYRDMSGSEGIGTTTSTMRSLCQRPGRKDKEGNPIYTTQQNHKKECDINCIIKKYDKTGLISHISKFEAKFGDHRGVDFKDAMDLIINSQNSFDKLPSEIRSRFGNSPEHLLSFMEDGDNRSEAIKLGLIHESWTEATDGLGEHVAEGNNVIKPPPETPVVEK